MKFDVILAALCATSLVSAFPSPDTTALSLREAEAAPESWSILEKRRGGGGGKGGGGSSGGKGGSSSSSGGGKPASSYSFSTTSNAGGRTQQGSGIKPTYPGGRYVGGATVPYTAGARSPSRSIAPYAIGAAGIGAFAFFPGIWLYGIYGYPYGIHYNHTYPNGTTIPANVTCLCQRYQVCGCDPTDNATFVRQVINNGSGSEPVNTSSVIYAMFPNGTQAAYINGSLPNGTTASGGTDPSNADEISAGVRMVQVYGGYAAMAAVVVGSVLI